MSYTLSVVNGDIDFNLYGRVRTVNGTNKAAQDLGEMIQSKFDRKRGGYGTNLDVGVVGALDQSAWIRSELQSLVTRFQSMQQRAGVKDPNELVTGVKSINVTTDKWGSYTWNLQVYVGSGTLVTSYNGVIGRRRTALLGERSATQAVTSGTTAKLSADETIEQAQKRIKNSANWGSALPGFVWKSPELPLSDAIITAVALPSDEFAPTSVTVTPTIPATSKPVHHVSYVINGIEVATATVAPYIVTIPSMQAGSWTISIRAKAADTSVVGAGSVQINLIDYPADRVWSGSKGAIDKTKFRIATAWPFKGSNGIGTYPSGGKGAIDKTKFTFRDGTYAEDHING